MKSAKKLLLTLVLLWGLLPVGIALGPSLPAFAAYNPLDKACKNGGEQSAACSSADQNRAITGQNGIIVKATRIVAALAGIAAVIMMVIYGIMLTTSYGDSGKATTARNGIIAACLGLVIVILAQAIVVFVVSNI